MQIPPLLQKCAELEIRDEHGEILDVDFEPPAREKDLRGLEKRIKTRLPESLREMLEFSNGLVLFRHEIFGTQDARLFPEKRLLSIHDWGTDRDFDCIALADSQWPEGSIIFVNGDPNRAIAYASSLLVWLERVIDEVIANRYWYCPGNYVKFGVEGVAKKVIFVAEQEGWRLSPPTPEELRRKYGR